MDECVERYLEAVCCHIRDKKIREQTREELLSHIEEAALELISNGVSQEEAYQRVVQNMGAAEETGCKLGEVHSRFPAQDFRQAMTRLCWGLGLCFFRLELGTLTRITDFLGAMLILSALICMVKCNRPLKIACVLFLINFCLSSILESSVYILPPSETLKELMDVRPFLSLGIYFLFMCFLIHGLSKLVQGERAYRIKLCILQYIGIVFLTFLCMVKSLPAIICVIPAALLYICILVKLSRLRSYLWKCEESCNIGKMSVFARCVLLGTPIFILIFPVLLSIAVNLAPPACQKTEAVNGDLTGKIQTELLSRGFPEHILVNLPSDEIQQYEGAKNIDVFSQELENGKLQITLVTAYFTEEKCRLLLMVQPEETLTLPRTERMDIIFSGMDNISSSERNKSIRQYFYKSDGLYQAEAFWHGYFSDHIESGSNMFSSWNSLVTNDMKEYVEFKLMPNSDQQYFYYAINTVCTDNSVMYIEFYHQTGLLRIPFAISGTLSRPIWEQDNVLFRINRGPGPRP